MRARGLLISVITTIALAAGAAPASAAKDTSDDGSRKLDALDVYSTYSGCGTTKIWIANYKSGYWTTKIRVYDSKGARVVTFEYKGTARSHTYGLKLCANRNPSGTYRVTSSGVRGLETTFHYGKLPTPCTVKITKEEYGLNAYIVTAELVRAGDGYAKQYLMFDYAKEDSDTFHYFANDKTDSNGEVVWPYTPTKTYDYRVRFRGDSKTTGCVSKRFTLRKRG